MEITHNPWEWTTVKNDSGSYTLVRADEETRRKQLEDYKNTRREFLQKQMRKLDELL